MFQHRPNLLLVDAREPLDELVGRCAAGEVLEEGVQRHSRSGEGPSPADLAGAALHGRAGLPVHPFTSLPPSSPLPPPQTAPHRRHPAPDRLSPRPRSPLRRGAGHSEVERGTLRRVLRPVADCTCGYRRLPMISERIDHPQALVVLPIAQVLGVHGVAAAGVRGGENRPVPVRQPKALTERDAGAEDGERDVLHRKLANGPEKP